MLDSTSGKILTTADVDKSLQSKNAGTEDTTIIKPLTNEARELSTVNEEAEVRLVFKFTVEEHLIYKGKIERVQQLQNEELSRLVSRVAWDVANETKNNETQKRDKTTQIDDSFQDLKKRNLHNSNLRSLSTQTNETSFPSQVSVHEPCGDIPCVKKQNEPSKTSARHNDELSHYIAPSETKLISSERNLENSLFAQQAKTPNSQLETFNCDTSSYKKLSNHIHKNLTNFSNKLEEFNSIIETNIIPKSKFETSKNIETKTGIKHSQSTIEDMLDIQSITETLKECLDSVDFEINQRNNDPTNKTMVEKSSELDNLKPRDSSIQITTSQNMTLDKSDETELKKLDTNVINMTNNEIEARNQELTQHKQEQQSYNEKDNFFEDGVQMVLGAPQPNKKEFASAPNVKKTKRIYNDESSSSKRNRKGISKDQRNSSSRKTALNKTDEKLSSKQKETESFYPTSDTNPKNFPLLDKSEHRKICHTNKIFAKWTDNHYYPGTILRQAKDRKYVIGFLDGAQRNVAEIDLIPLTNIEGRQVRVSIAKNYCVNALVHDQSSTVNDQPMFDVEYQQDGLIRKCVPFKDIFLTGDQGSLLINQVDRSSGGSNFADVDLDNIIYEKRSRRLQDMEDYELADNSSLVSKKKRKYNIRNPNTKTINNNVLALSTSPESISSPASSINSKRNSHNDNIMINDSESTGSPDNLKTHFQCPNSNPPSESSSSTGSSNVPNALELGQEFYFASSSPHRTKTSLLL